MLNDEICKKRDELNNSIEQEQEYSVIYKLSVELDDLIAEHYRRSTSLKRKKILRKSKDMEISMLI